MYISLTLRKQLSCGISVNPLKKLYKVEFIIPIL